MNINELINEAKKRYKVGDRFRVVHLPDTIRTIRSFELCDDMLIVYPDGDWYFNLLVTDSPFTDCATVCHKGKWAEKVEPVFVTEDGKNIYEGENCWKVGVDEERKLPFISHITAGDLTDASKVKYFSNEYNARNYYSELSKQSLRANTGKFEIGDKVKVTRKCESYEGGWAKVWSSEMDECVNGTYKITNEFPMSSAGYRLDCGYWFPEFVLEKVVTKYLADEFQVLKLEPYEDELPTSPKGKLFDTLEEANAYHESVKPNTYTVELPKGYEVKREYVILGNIELIDGIFLKLKHI